MSSKQLFILFLLSVMARCSQPLDKKQLTGYWQIEKVTQGGETFYPAVGNTQFDFYHLKKNDNGFRKKLSLGLGQTMHTSKDQTNFQLKQVEGKWVLAFETPWDQWNETIIKLTDQKLVLVHKDRQYTYQRKQIKDEAL